MELFVKVSMVGVLYIIVGMGLIANHESKPRQEPDHRIRNLLHSNRICNLFGLLIWPLLLIWVLLEPKK